MFRKMSLLVAALALMVLVPQAQAARGDWKISLLGGIAVPIGDFSQKILEGGLGARMGFTAGPSIDYMVTDQVAVGVDGYYARNGMNTEERDLLRSIDPTFDLKFTQFGGAAHVKYFFPLEESPMDVYVVGGAGFTNFKVEATALGFSGSESENKFSGFGGVGLGFQVGNAVSIGVQSDINYVSLTGGSAPSFGVKAGLMFAIPAGGAR